MMVNLHYIFLATAYICGGVFGEKMSERLAKELARVQLKDGESHPMVVKAAQIDRSAWTITADSYQNINPPQAAIDGNTSTFWHSQYNPNLPLPHNITIDMKQTMNLNGFVYTPRQDGNSNGNIGQHKVQVSTDGTSWTTVAFGTYLDDSEVKTTPFVTTPARYLRVLAITEAGNRGSWSSIADISITTGTLTTGSPSSIGSWGPTIEFPIVPVSAAILASTGQILTWSSYTANAFSGTSTGITLTSTYDPASGIVSQQTVSNTGHDMFCPGISMDNTGGIVVTGGNTAPATSRYSTGSFPAAWSRLANMTTARGYQSQVTLSDGRIFTIGGSWSGGQGGKNGEVLNVTSNRWTALSGAPVAPMLTNDAGGVYRADNHAWLFAWKNSYVLQAGPSKAMNWYRISGSGSQTSAGSRAADGDAMCGNAVMFDAVAGKILTAGGSPSYQDSQATTNAHVITLGGSPPNLPSVSKVGSMQYARAFANGVVLPNGQVFIAGGQSTPVPFSDATSQFTPELFDPASNTFRSMAPQAAPRVYHSVALLMPDASVFVAGGGLCGNCATNHRDGQVWSPPYLFTSSGARASRPVISSLSAASVRVGGSLSVSATAGSNAGSAVKSFSLVRTGSVTHTVNTDQRRVAITPTANGGNSYTLALPSDAGVLVPGQWMLFAIDANGVPSVAKMLQITN